MPETPAEEKDSQNDEMKRELEALKPELQLIKSEVTELPDHHTLFTFSHVSFFVILGPKVCSGIKISSKSSGI